MGLPFIDLKSQFRALETDIRTRIDRVLEHGQYIMGPEVRELESKLAAFVGTDHAITCSSGTDALLMPLMAFGVGPGQAVFTTPFTFFATAEVVSLLGATPVFVDIDPRTFNLDPEKLETAVDQVRSGGKLEPSCVIAVDLFGLPADYPAIEAIATRHGMRVLEDAAQSFGAEYGGRRAGSFGDAAATSFFPAKPLGCYGDGGAVFTDDDELAERLRSIRVHGKGAHKYDNVRIGLNARLDTLQAAVLLSKLEAFPDEIQARRRIARRYSTRLGNYVECPFVPPGYESAWAQYSVLDERRDEMQARLEQAGIPTVVYYPKPVHLSSAYAGLGYAAGSLPVAESTSLRIFSLPMHPYLSDQDQEEVVSHLQSVSASGC